jgi:hypothetical protein
MLLCPPVAIKRGPEGGKTPSLPSELGRKLEKTNLLSHKKIAPQGRSQYSRGEYSKKEKSKYVKSGMICVDVYVYTGLYQIVDGNFYIYICM